MNPSLINPFVSVIIRSFNRLPYVLEIIEICQQQTYDNFEVVVVDQSDADHWAANEAGFADLPGNIRILRFEPLGGSLAKNTGVANARGDVVLFMDDDDLPLGNDWIALHADHYKDPYCIGVSGRTVNRHNEPFRGRRKQLAYRRCLTYSYLLRGRDLTSIDIEKKPVDWLHGLNASIRRSSVVELGGWYPHVKNFDEHSFCFRLRKAMSRGEYLMFDPKPQARRRYAIEGGLGKRLKPLSELMTNHMEYYHWVVRPHFPFRFYLWYPIIVFHAFHQTARWILKHSRYADSYWIRTFGMRPGQYCLIMIELLKLPFLSLRFLFSKRPLWDGKLPEPLEV